MPPIDHKFEGNFLNLNDVERGIMKLRRRIEDLDRLRSNNVKYNDAQAKMVLSDIHANISEIFGPNSREYHENENLRFIRQLSVTDTDSTRQAKFQDGIQQIITILEGLIRRLQERKEEFKIQYPDYNEDIPDINNESESSILPKRVFVVHGHDEAAKLKIVQFLKLLDLEIIVLSDKPNEGKTVIEKFEKHSDVGFAVVILTPDDIGYPKGQPKLKQPRARQNVILELGYFIGTLKRARVCALHKGNVELPSDIHGILYVPMDDDGGWKLMLAREIKAAGIDIDMNKVI